MKHLKQLLAVALTMLMALAILSPATKAYAEEEEAATGTITITVPTQKQAPTEATTYKIYKVFNATVNKDDPTKISYTLAKGTTLTGDMATYFDVDDNGNVTVKDAAKDADGKLVADAIDAIAAYVDGDDPVATVTAAVGATSVTSDGLPYGYYYITTTTGTVVTIDSNNGNPTVEDKNIIPTVNKSAGTAYDAASLKAIAAVGTDQPFTAQVIKTKGAYNVVFKDDMTNMTYNGDLKVTVDGTEVAAGASTYSVSGAAGAASFTVTFVDSYIAGLADDTVITLNYTGKVTSDALSVSPATNKATLTSGNGNSVESKTVEVYNAKISVFKQDGQKQPLAGAKFKLKNADGLYYAGSGTDGTANWTADGIEVEAVLTEGKYVAEFKGLADGEYTLQETTVPKGYNKAADQTITIAADDYTAENLNQEATVINQSGTELPSTGGIGTTIFYVVGGALVITAGVLLVTKRRMANVEA